jgi:glycerol-3-phosphate dehydrogenase
MARDLVDTVLSDNGLPPRPCVTHTIPLVGSSVVSVDDTPEVAALSAVDRDTLDRRYGSKVGEVLAIMADDPQMARSLPNAQGFVRAEVVHACQAEGAGTLADVLDRRLSVGLNLDVVTPELVAAAAAIMGQTLGWNDETTRRATSDYIAEQAGRP